jgi:hypothetical protein
MISEKNVWSQTFTTQNAQEKYNREDDVDLIKVKAVVGIVES